MEPSKSKYVIFWPDREYGKTHKTQYINVTTRRGEPFEEIGHIKWYPAWRKYCFFPDSETLYEAKCLSDIESYINFLMDGRKANPAKDNEGD